MRGCNFVNPKCGHVCAQQCQLFTCDPTVQQKEMALSLAAAKSLASLHISSSPQIDDEEPAPDHGTLCMPERSALPPTGEHAGSLADADFGEAACHTSNGVSTETADFERQFAIFTSKLKRLGEESSNVDDARLLVVTCLTEL